MKEISFQTMGTGITYLILGSTKNLLPTFPIHIGNYGLLNGSHARKEANS